MITFEQKTFLIFLTFPLWDDYCFLIHIRDSLIQLIDYSFEKLRSLFFNFNHNLALKGVYACQIWIDLNMNKE